MDIIFIEQLSVFTTIGVYEWEKTIKQKLLLDIKIKWDNYRVVKNNQEVSFLDYAQISQKVITHIETKTFTLIECVAQDVADIILNNFKSYWVCVKVCKPNAVMQAKQVGVIIERIKLNIS